MNPELNLYSLSSDNKELAIDFRPVTSTSVIPLGFTGATVRPYTLRVLDINLDPNMVVYLRDKFTGNSLNLLTSGGTYNFNVTADPASSASQSLRPRVRAIGSIAGNAH